MCELAPVINANPVMLYAVGAVMFTVFFLHIMRSLLLGKNWFHDLKTMRERNQYRFLHRHMYSLVLQLMEFEITDEGCNLLCPLYAWRAPTRIRY